MKNDIELGENDMALNLPNGDRIVLLNRLVEGDPFTDLEAARNIYRIDADGNAVWQVHSDFDQDGDPFTNIRLENGLIGYRWEGIDYSIDLDNGLATPMRFVR